MKRTVAKFYSFVLVLMTVLTLTACGGKKVDYTGTYTGQIDFSSFQAGMSSELGIEISDPLYMEIKLVMNEDETFTLSADEAKLKSDIIEVMRAHLDDILENILEPYGMTLDDLPALAEQKGYDSVEAFKEDMLAQMEASLDEVMVLSEIADQFSESGTYKIENKNITLTSDDGENVDIMTINDDGTLNYTVNKEDVIDVQDITMTKQAE